MGAASSSLESAGTVSLTNKSHGTPLSKTFTPTLGRENSEEEHQRLVSKTSKVASHQEKETFPEVYPWELERYIHNQKIPDTEKLPLPNQVSNSKFRGGLSKLNKVLQVSSTDGGEWDSAHKVGNLLLGPATGLPYCTASGNAQNVNVRLSTRNWPFYLHSIKFHPVGAKNSASMTYNSQFGLALVWVFPQGHQINMNSYLVFNGISQSGLASWKCRL
eukprot:TRINITY_DN11600_c0_g1_i1.p1 TRINITY_DN11600_c0_g1~~TRINITY_DN11600_c0_g1_i1.p1  ORF type:complete len:218 (+),score=10.04 TRINITY_DN11600_c0_g1_i1:71-724(+)